jgi:hypothetical protein
MPEIRREFIERRGGRNRRRFPLLSRIGYSGPDRRRRERRAVGERREGWIRVTKWSSAPLKDLKIAKYLLKSEASRDVGR